MSGILAVIPARGGSKGIPRKNVRAFLGKPLLAWTVLAAQKSQVADRIVVSTDDEEIAAICRSLDVEIPFLRPHELAGDEVPTGPVIRHALDWMHGNDGWVPGHVLVLEPTSPGRRTQHIREAAALLINSGADTVASVSEIPHHYVPPKALQLQRDGVVVGADGTHPREMIHRRQELPRYYAFNGLIFACKVELLLQDSPTLWGERVLGYVVDAEYSVDLDRHGDWVPAEAQLRLILEGGSA